MSANRIVMGAERRQILEVAEEIPMPKVDWPEPVYITKKEDIPEKTEKSEAEKRAAGDSLEPQATRSQSDAERYAYTVHHYDDLKKTKPTEKKFYTSAKVLMKELEISKTTFYKYLKLGAECPKSYTIQKM